MTFSKWFININWYLILYHLLYSQTNATILVVGGSGRVGGAAIRSLLKRGYEVHVGGRNPENWSEYIRRFNNQVDAKFIQMDAQSEASLENQLMKYDLIINTAGPFQGLRKSLLFEKCIDLGKKYIDVCDDIELSRICRLPEYQQRARDSGASAVISAGIWPGGSSLLAQSLLQTFQSSVKTISSSGTIISTDPVVDKVTFSFFTAGSGGAGETILTATFLLLGEDVLIYANGKPEKKKPATDGKYIDFGKYVGQREVVRLNLIECESCFQSSKVANIETFFGTAPMIWNKLFVAMARLTPQKILQNRSLMKKFAQVSLPMVRLVDRLVGSTNGR